MLNRSILFLSLSSSLMGIAWHSNTWVANIINSPPELPAQKCQEAQEFGVEYDSALPTPPKAPNPLPFPEVSPVASPEKLPRLTNQKHYPLHFLPEDLKLQPFEGKKE